MERKKITDNLSVDNNSKANQPTQQMKKVIKREEYFEPTDNNSKLQSAQSTLPTAQIEMIDETDYEEDKFFAFLERLDRDQGYKLRVDSLPQYNANGKWAKDTTFGFCGEYPISVDELYSEEYYGRIQQMYGPGAYRLSLKDSAGKYVKKWLTTIAAPMSAQQNSVIQPPGQSQPVQQQGDPLDALIEQAGKFEKLKKVLGWNAEPAAGPTAATPVAKDKPLEEKVTGLILDKILESKDENLTDRFIARYLGEDKEPDFSWRDVAKEVIMPLVPVAVSLASAFLGNRPAGNGAVSADTTPAPQGDLSQPQPQLQAPPPVATNTQKLLGLTRQDCLMAMPVERTAVAFDVLTTEENQAELQAIFSLSPQEILERLQIPVNLERVQWVQELQAELKGDEEALEVVQ